MASKFIISVVTEEIVGKSLDNKRRYRKSSLTFLIEDCFIALLYFDYTETSLFIGKGKLGT